MIAGVLSPHGVADAAPQDALREPAGTAADALLSVAWSGSIDASDADGLLVLIDGVLWPLAGDAQRAVRDGWRREGSQFPARLRGAFTILVWDRERRIGALASDHVSMRNCYLHEEAGRLRFATGIPVIRRLVDRPLEPNAPLIVTWIGSFEFLQGHDTMLAGIRRLGSATVLELGAHGWRRRRYWAPQWRGTTPGEPHEHVAALRAGIERAVRLRVDTEAPAAVMLSGGFDSATVAAVAAREGYDLRAYSAVFPNHPRSDESDRVDAMVRTLGVPAMQSAMRPQGGLRHAAEYLRDWGIVPGGTGGMLEQPLLRQAAADGTRVVLDGQGGDEVFGFAPFLLADRLLQGRLNSIRQLMNRVPDFHSRPHRALLKMLVLEFTLAGAVEPRLHRLWRRLRPSPPGEPADFLSRSAVPLLTQSDPWSWKQTGVPRWWAWHAHVLTDAREGSQHSEYIYQRGASHGLVPAAPLLDVDLVELALRLPPDLAWRRLNRPVARAAVQDLLPPEVLSNTRKANLGYFYLDVVTGADYPIARELLLDPRARLLQWADAEPLKAFVDRRPTRYDEGWLDWLTRFWRLVTAEMFLRWLEDESWVDRFLAREDVPALEAELRFG